MTKRQAQNVAAALFGPRAIGQTCRLVETTPNRYALIGQADIAGEPVAVMFHKGRIKYRFHADWTTWDPEDPAERAEEFIWLADAEDARLQTRLNEADQAQAD